MAHISVLLKEIIDGLQVQDNDVFVDMTLGNAGHSKAILDNAKNITLIGIDADEIAIKKAKEVLNPYQEKNKIIIENSYFDLIGEILDKNNIEKIDKVLFDLGFRSEQVDNPERGFSFMQDGPLDMSFESAKDISSRQNKITAEEIVNEWQEESIADIIYGFGEEKFARRIAKRIIEEREKNRIKTTLQLSEIIKKAVPIFYRYGKINPATKTFQALRIAVNGELDRIKKALEITFDRLNPNGKIAVISFHSLEDRIIKNFFKEKVSNNQAVLINKKPITANSEELKNNPRSRSAKLRIIKKNEH